MRTLSAQFVEAVNKAWGNPERVADAAISETWRLAKKLKEGYSKHAPAKIPAGFYQNLPT